MLPDIRIHQCKPGMRDAQFELFNGKGLGAQSRILDDPFAYIKSIEDPNEFILIWQYDDLADREAQCELMWDDPEWQEHVTLSKSLGAVVSQYGKLVETVET